MAQTKQFAVIGLGRFGRAVARTLTHLGHEVLGLDESTELMRQVQDEQIVTHAIQCDATNIHALREAGLRNVDTVVLAIGTDLEAAVLILTNLLELGLTSVLAKASHRRYGMVLERVGGANVRVVYPEEQMGERVAQGLGGTGVLAAIDLDPATSIVEVAAPRAFAGKTLAELQLRLQHGVTVIAIRRHGAVNAAPGGTDRIEAGDVLAMIGPNEKLAALQRA